MGFEPIRILYPILEQKMLRIPERRENIEGPTERPFHEIAVSETMFKLLVALR